MTHRIRPSRGLTLIELLLALAITAMVAMTISTMLGAVTQGVMTRRDVRGVLIAANAAQTRLAAYIVPANCILASSSSSMVIWLNDEMESDTVHASEVRWISFDSTTGDLVVEFVSWPSDWPQTARDLANLECSKTMDWALLKSAMTSRGLIAKTVLVDQVDSLSITLDSSGESARHVIFDVGFAGTNQTHSMILSATIRIPKIPVK